MAARVNYWQRQMDLLVTFQAVVWDCYWVGKFGIDHQKSGRVFFQCLNDFTKDVQWYNGPSNLQNDFNHNYKKDK